MTDRRKKRGAADPGSGRLGRPHPEWGDNVIEGDFGAASRRRAGKRKADRQDSQGGADTPAPRERTPRRPREVRRSDAPGQEGWAAQVLMRSVSAGADTGRLSRGLTYFREGAVFQLDAELGRVSALVRGSQLEPFEVQLRWRPLSPHQVAYVSGEITEHPDNLRLLLAGRAPLDEVAAVLFRESDFMDSWCTCPDHGVVCKHRVAVAHELGECFTRDPGEFLAWRGLDPAALVDATTGERAGAPGAPGADAPGEAAEAADGAAASEPVYPPEQFWGEVSRVPEWEPMATERGLDLGDPRARDAAVRAVSWNTVDQLNVLSQLEECYDVFTGRYDGGESASDGRDRDDDRD
jgi:uncharacterized Zn finger protein